MWQMTCFAPRHMFGVIKRIFRKAEPAREPDSSVALKPRAAVPTQASPTAPPPLPDTFAGTACQPLESPAPTNGDHLSLSYAAILRQMPKELFGRLAPEGLTGSFFMVPRQQVVEQLPQGTVRIPFGELRRAAPLGVFTNNSSHDGRLVDLPLAEIIPQLPTEAYQRRMPEQVLTPPEEVTDIFGPKGQCLSNLRVVPKREAHRPVAGAASYAPSTSAASLGAFRPGTGSRSGAAPVPVMPVTFPARTTPPRSTGPAPAVAQVRPTPAFTPASTNPVAPRARAVAPLTNPVKPLVSAAKPIPRSVQKPAAPAPVASEPTPAASEQDASPFSVELAELAAAWPDAVREEIAQLQIPHVRVELPPAVVCEGLKRGAVRFTWGELRSWVVSAPQVTVPSPVRGVELDLPLNVLTPLFLDFIRAAQLNRKVASAERITEFFRRAAAESASPSAPAAATSPASPPASAAANEVESALSVSLSLVSVGWPEAILHEIQQHRLSDSRIELPVEAVEVKLRAGKADFSWRQLTLWIPGCPSEVTASPNGATVVNLPLSVLAPMFLKRRGSTAPRRPMSDLGIPDVFATPGKPAAEPPAVAPAPVAAVESPAALAPVAPEPPPQRKATNLAELFGEPGKKTWTPKELVQGMKRLPGVAGSLVALQDGLLVAQSMPADWKSEAMAAFLPQIFGRINQYTKELKTGDARAVAITTDAGMIQVYQAGIVYLAVLGEPDATLPLDDLQLVAGELSRRTP